MINLTEPTNLMEFINYMYAKQITCLLPKDNTNVKIVGCHLTLNKSFSSMLTKNMLGQLECIQLTIFSLYLCLQLPIRSVMRKRFIEQQPNL